MTETSNKKSTFKKETPENLYEQSHSLFYAKQFPEVIYLCKRAVKLNPKFRKPYLRLGNIYSIFRHYDEANDYYNRFLKYSLDEDNKTDICKGYNALGYLFCSRKNYQDALKYYYLSLDIAQSLKLDKEIARSYNNIALTHRFKKDYEKAYYLYKKALNISIKNKHIDRMAYYYFNIAILFKEQKKYLRATWFMWKFKKLDKKLKKMGFYLSPSQENLPS